MNEKKSSSIAIILSYFPGLGHIYLHKYCGLLVLLPFYLGIIAYFSIWYSLLGLHNDIIGSGENIIYILLTGIFLIITTWAFSVIDTEYQCIISGLPINKTIKDKPLQNYGRALRILVFLPALIGLFYSCYVYIFQWTDYIPFIQMIFWFMVALASWILIKRYRNVTFNEIKHYLGNKNKTGEKWDNLSKKERMIITIFAIVFVALCMVGRFIMLLFSE